MYKLFRQTSINKHVAIGGQDPPAPSAYALVAMRRGAVCCASTSYLLLVSLNLLYQLL